MDLNCDMALVHDLHNDELIDMLKSAFVKNKNNTEAGKRKYYINPVHENCFSIAAETCRKLNADPVVFIDSIFHGSDPDKIFPNFITNVAWTMKKYNEYCNTYFVKADVVFPVLLRLLKSQLETGRELKDILLSDYLNFPAWFRCCISKEPIPEVLDKYKAAAMNEMSVDVKQLLRDKNLQISRIYGIR